MKTFIASDFHGKDPTGLVRTLYKNGEIGKAVFLGDYDESHILRRILNLDIDKLVLVGNHEYEFCRKSKKVGFVDEITQLRYWKMWGETDAGNFARECPTKIEENIIGKQVVYLHGSLLDACGSETPCEVWGSLHDFHGYGFSDERRVECNFNEMKKNNYWAMFRGHDHYSEVHSTDRDEYLGHMRQITSTVSDVILKKDDMNIVTVGAFENGEYCIFDDLNLSLEFKSLKRNRFKF